MGDNAEETRRLHEEIERLKITTRNAEEKAREAEEKAAKAMEDADITRREAETAAGGVDRSTSRAEGPGIRGDWDSGSGRPQRERERPPIWREGDEVMFLSTFRFYLSRLGLEHTLHPQYEGLRVIGGDPAAIKAQFGARMFGDHQKAYNDLLVSLKDSPLRHRLVNIGSMFGAWREVVQHHLPNTDLELETLKRKLENLAMKPGEKPRTYFLRFEYEAAYTRWCTENFRFLKSCG